MHREEACGGHELWAVAGTIYEQRMNVHGEREFVEVTRHQPKRDTTLLKDGSRRHQFYARFTVQCPDGPAHDWWEPLLEVRGDKSARFNRAEYLRVAPIQSARHARLYGMRQDTESLNAQLERAFYG